MITFFVPGIPVPKGSAKAFMRKGMRFPVVVQDNAEKQKPWASMIGYTAKQAGVEMVTGPVSIAMLFIFPRPKSHYGTGKNAGILKPWAPYYHVVKPDQDKLVRCVKDALTGIAWVDDCQACMYPLVTKVYGDTPGVQITLDAIEDKKRS